MDSYATFLESGWTVILEGRMRYADGHLVNLLGLICYSLKIHNEKCRSRKTKECIWSKKWLKIEQKGPQQRKKPSYLSNHSMSDSFKKSINLKKDLMLDEIVAPQNLLKYNEYAWLTQIRLDISPTEKRVGSSQATLDQTIRLMVIPTCMSRISREHSIFWGYLLGENMGILYFLFLRLENI